MLDVGYAGRGDADIAYALVDISETCMTIDGNGLLESGADAASFGGVSSSGRNELIEAQQEGDVGPDS